MAEIYIENLCKEFGKTVAVNELTLQIKDGELIVFLGPSGCGKTTTLNCIAGLETPTRGKIYFNGKDVTYLPPHVRNIAMVFQSSLLYPHLTGRQNIQMSLRKSNISREEINSRIEEIAKLLHIEPLLDKLPSEMSGGERQRVATAKAIVRQPEAFLMDEPLANLDAALRESLRAELVNLQKTLGVTMVFVTHDQVEAMTMGDRIAVMKNGNLQQVGAPEEVYNSPKNLFVAGFIGSPPMNFFRGRLVCDEGGFNFVYRELRIRIPDHILENVAKFGERDVILGIRPQHVLLHRSAEPGTLETRVFGVERLGKEFIIIMECGEEEKIKAIVPPDFHIRVGDIVYVMPRAEYIFLFDPETERSITVI
mgnify:CR=1 FL=1